MVRSRLARHDRGRAGLLLPGAVMSIQALFKTPSQAHAENYYPWRIYSGQELRGAARPALMPAMWSFVWLHSRIQFQSHPPLLKDCGSRSNLTSRFWLLFKQRKVLVRLFKQDWAFITAAHCWINEMPNDLYSRLSAGQDPIRYFDRWYAYHRMSRKDGPETVKLYQRSSYRLANQMARGERKALIETRWNARMISRATVEAKGQTRVGRL